MSVGSPATVGAATGFKSAGLAAVDFVALVNGLSAQFFTTLVAHYFFRHCICLLDVRIQFRNYLDNVTFHQGSLFLLGGDRQIPVSGADFAV